MKIYYRAENRKSLAEAISEFTETDAVYMRAPTYAYQIDYFTVDREGNLNFDDRADSAEIENLLEFLYGKGFIAEEKPQVVEENASQSESMGLTLSFPLNTVKLDNLKNLLKSKGALIQKALGIRNTEINADEEKVSFPWFTQTGEPLPSAYMQFVEALCRMSLKQKRISYKTKQVENEKYAFRCFLLRLGFIGKEYKEERKLLLKNFSGSSAFKNGTRKDKNDVSK